MEILGKNFVSRRIIVYEVIAFVSIIMLIWIDEVLDLPYLLLGADKTALNWKESLFESTCIFLLGAAIINFTIRIFQKMKYLEGILPVCSYCKKIRDEKGRWRQLESYIYERSEAEFSHSICPECEEKLYNEINKCE